MTVPTLSTETVTPIFDELAERLGLVWNEDWKEPTTDDEPTTD